MVFPLLLQPVRADPFLTLLRRLVLFSFVALTVRLPLSPRWILSHREKSSSFPLLLFSLPLALSLLVFRRRDLAASPTFAPNRHVLSHSPDSLIRRLALSNSSRSSLSSIPLSVLLSRSLFWIPIVARAVDARLPWTNVPRDSLFVPIVVKVAPYAR